MLVVRPPNARRPVFRVESVYQIPLVKRQKVVILKFLGLLLSSRLSFYTKTSLLAAAINNSQAVRPTGMNDHSTIIQPPTSNPHCCCTLSCIHIHIPLRHDKRRYPTNNLKCSPLSAVQQGLDNIGGDETITIGFSNHHHEDDDNDEVSKRQNSCLMHHFYPCITLTQSICHNTELPRHSIIKKKKAK